MKKISILILLIFVYSATHAQKIKIDSLSRNAVYFEALGNGILYSINYERMIVNKINNKINIHSGMGYLLTHQDETFPVNNFIVPLEVSFLKRDRNHFNEFGLGTTLLFNNSRNDPNNKWAFIGRAGYRREKPSGYVFRFGFLVIVAADRYHAERGIIKTHYVIFPSIGLSFGKGF